MTCPVGGQEEAAKEEAANEADTLKKVSVAGWSSILSALKQTASGGSVHQKRMYEHLWPFLETLRRQHFGEHAAVSSHQKVLRRDSSRDPAEC